MLIYYILGKIWEKIVEFQTIYVNFVFCGEKWNYAKIITIYVNLLYFRKNLRKKC